MYANDMIHVEAGSRAAAGTKSRLYVMSLDACYPIVRQAVALIFDDRHH